eukprot:CAMPEP_0185603376 /NCGR_PEP_ID=MMETSP0436-20130131/2423_1 /TAXON_ID=626734 ORGANISM="Favella taraikaensis, Strain Fe Narragansett Bay" /NCGR_SAMPLE_ID=MMETSP0436 /ASSEMBLY_ACC=CAM_ASM_000390 /LENGTH=38 /DNA_ID= /DNA_START= /DNA_END= /DNA_ORIENTATION=
MSGLLSKIETTIFASIKFTLDIVAASAGWVLGNAVNGV